MTHPRHWVKTSGELLALAADQGVLREIAALAPPPAPGLPSDAVVDAALLLLQRLPQPVSAQLRETARLLLCPPAQLLGERRAKLPHALDWTPLEVAADGSASRPGVREPLGFRFEASVDSGMRLEIGAAVPGQIAQTQANLVLGVRLRGQVDSAAGIGFPIRLGAVGLDASNRASLEVQHWFVLPPDQPIAGGIANCLGALANPFSLAGVGEAFERGLLAMRVVADGCISIAGRYKAGLAVDAVKMAEGTLGVQARFRALRAGRFRLLLTRHAAEQRAVQLTLEQLHREGHERGLGAGLTLELGRLLHELRPQIIDQTGDARDLFTLLEDFFPPSRAISARLQAGLQRLHQAAPAELAAFAGGSPEAPALADLAEAIATLIDTRAEVWSDAGRARAGALAQDALDDLAASWRRDPDPADAPAPASALDAQLRDPLRRLIEDALVALHEELANRLGHLSADAARFEPLRQALQRARKLPRRRPLDDAAARLDAVAEPVRALLDELQHNLAQLAAALERSGGIKANARWRWLQTRERGQALSQRLVFRPGADATSARFAAAAQLYRRALTGSFDVVLDAALDAAGDPRHAPVEQLEGSLRAFANLRRESAFEIALLEFALQRQSLLDTGVEIDTDAAGNVRVLGRTETRIDWRSWWEARSFRGINVYELASARATRHMTLSLALNHDDKRLKQQEVRRFFDGLEDRRIGLLPAGSARRAAGALASFAAGNPKAPIEGELRVELTLQASALRALLQLDQTAFDSALVYRTAISAVVAGRAVTGSRAINRNLAAYARRHDGAPSLKQLLLDLGDPSKRLSLIDPKLEDGGQFDDSREQVKKIARLAEALGSALQDMRAVYRAPTTWGVEDFSRRQERIGETLQAWARGEPAGRGLAETWRNDSVRPGMLALFKTIAELSGSKQTGVSAHLLLRAAGRTRQLQLLEPLPPAADGQPRPMPRAEAALSAAPQIVHATGAEPVSTLETRAMAEYIFPLPSRPDRDFESGGRAFRSRRSGGKRWHAGCDLIKPTGTPILAMADGTVLRGPYYFYSNTYALEVKHTGGRVVRYGEIQKQTPKGVHVGATVKQGQVIGWVGRLKSGSQMLHLEMYKGTRPGRLTTSGANRYMRRADIMDPTGILKAAPLLGELQAPANAGGSGADAGAAARTVAGKVNQQVPGSLNLRAAQRLDADVRGELARGTRVAVLRSLAGDPHPFGDHVTWYEVRVVDGLCAGRSGFVVGHFVTPESALGEIPQAEPSTYGRVSARLDGSLRMRESPWLHAKQIGKLERGDTVHVVDAQVDGDKYRWDRDDWMRVKRSDDGLDGYVAGYFIDILDEDPESAGQAFRQQPSPDDLPDELTATLLQTPTTGASSRTANASGIGIGGVGASQQMALQDLEEVQRHADRFRSVAGKAGIPAALLAAIASRESRCGRVLKNGWGDNGNGYGVLQVDKRHHQLRGLGDPFSTEHLEQGAAILNEKLFRINKKFPDWQQDYRLMGAVAAYNFGVGNVRSKEGINRGTAGDDYGADVIARAQFYHRHQALEIFRA
jgi:murein DD-endopeptidase MepM/ murein hydrolase activator NlpD